ncbi:hypothetical protein [Streptacidiphilus sp. EB103A]|uniref:hypothetical protein n=1 Tax=Streptacidiphilus sp. EB103A TaxID=3156275 RepID=UPI003517B327
MDENVNVAVRRVLPALPSHDEVAGELRWGRWEPALLVSHLDPRCLTCAYPGPLSTALGQSWYTPEPTHQRVERSSRDRPSKWVRVQRAPYWVSSHWAVRCPQCDETYVWRRADWVEIFHQPPTTERALPPTEDVLF